MRKLTTFLLLLAMLIPTAGAQSTDIFKKEEKEKTVRRKLSTKRKPTP